MEPTTLTVLFSLGSELVKKLESGELTQFGGVIREASTGRIVTFLREASSGAARIPQQLQQAQTLLQVGSAASVLSLGVSVMGFAVINQRLNELEKRLKQTEELLKKIDRKIDLGYYANFKAALSLASNAFKMSQSNNRRDKLLRSLIV